MKRATGAKKTSFVCERWSSTLMHMAYLSAFIRSMVRQKKNLAARDGSPATTSVHSMLHNKGGKRQLGRALITSPAINMKSWAAFWPQPVVRCPVHSERTSL